MLIKKEGGKSGIFTATSKYLTHGWGAPVDDDFVSFEGSKLTEGSLPSSLSVMIPGV